MKSSRVLWYLVLALVILSVSSFVAYLKLNQLIGGGTLPPKDAVVFGVTQSAQSPLTSLAQNPPADLTPENASALSPQQKNAERGTDNSAVPQFAKDCQQSPEFLARKEDLGKIVNRGDLRTSATPEFLEKINEFKSKFGLPLPLQLSQKQADAQHFVYNRCKTSCHGSVFQVFASQIFNQDRMDVLETDGFLHRVFLHDSGIDIAVVDELNRNGVPFRSWRAPISEGDWFIEKNDLYYSLDIEGLWLRIDLASHWTVVKTPPHSEKLHPVETPEAVLGCKPDESCLETSDHKRFFKAPKSCHSAISS